MLSSMLAVCGLPPQKARHFTEMNKVPALSRTSAALDMAGPISDEIAMSLNGVSHWFDGPLGRTQALADINMQIRIGEFFTVLGPSGCGKTTLLNIVGG